MKQYTTFEQTAKLIELGFEKPKAVSHCEMDLDMQIIPFGECGCACEQEVSAHLP